MWRPWFQLDGGYQSQENSKQIEGDKTYERINVRPLTTMRKNRMIDAIAQSILWDLRRKVAVEREFGVDVGRFPHRMYMARDIRAT